MTFGEGADRIRTGRGAQNMVTLRTASMNFLRGNGTSIADGRSIALAPCTTPLDFFGVPRDLHVRP